MSIPRIDTGKTHQQPAAKAVQPKAPAPEVKKPAASAIKEGDKSGLSHEAKNKEVSNANHVDALTKTLGGDEAAKKDPKAKGADAKDPKAEDGKKPPVEKQISQLQDDLKKAEASGDKEEIARIKAELEKLKQQQEGDKTGTDGTPPVGDANGGGAPAGGGGAPAGGGGAPAGGGGAPAGGGGAPAGGANEAGAGQGAGAGKEEVDQFIQFAAQAYGADPKVLSEIARRESNFNTGDIANNWDSNAKKGTPSKGMFQFIQPTFQSMAPQAKAANPGAWAGVSENWTDWKAQALTTAWAITHGKGNQWSTFKAAQASAGGGGTRMA